MYKKLFIVTLSIILLVISFAGCAGDKTTSKENSSSSSAITSSVSIVSTPSDNTSAKMGLVPTLPESGQDINAFIPDGWTLLDSVKMDYNRDGISDYVGVLEVTDLQNKIDWYPRILFSVTGQDGSKYKLEFQDINAIRTQDEGGALGDPYNPITTDGVNFTTHAYGGSSWRWSEDITYNYFIDGSEKGIWKVKEADYKSYRNAYEYEYSLDNYDTRVGVRMVSNGDDPEPQYQVKYSVSLDPPPTLQAYNVRGTFADMRLGDMPVNNVSVANGVNFDSTEACAPSDLKSCIQFTDEKYVIYTFTNQKQTQRCLALYDIVSKNVTIVTAIPYSTNGSSDFSYMKIYEGKLFYAYKVAQNFQVKQSDGSIKYLDEIISIRLCNVNLDGSGYTMIYEYKNKFEPHAVLEQSLPYIALIWEITGNEITFQVYIENQPHPFYRVNIDGSNLKYIDTLPRPQFP